MSLFAELKRRNVFRVALVYIVASWIVMQVADVGISLLGLPVTTGRLIFLLLAIGFPLVMLFSWVYEITPEGVRREKDIDRSVSVTHETAKKLDTAVIVLLILGIGALALDRLVPKQSAAPPESEASAGVEPGSAAPDRSIAVLPFVNMSADEENEYFSDGLSEELLNLLAKIPDLKVAARTSAFRFKDSDADISEIALQLNVAHVLEGSVRKSGDSIRITAQLINASDGYHIWSNTWDRTLTDVFAIQDEISAAVVDALKVEMLGEIPKAVVTDTVAYSLFLQAKQLANGFSADDFENAVGLLTQAVAIDPDYAEAWAELSKVQTNQVGQGYVDKDEGFPRAIAAAERALKIEPRHARALSNLGWISMYGDWDFAEAARQIREARRLEPGNASILNSYGVLNFAFGRREDGISLYREALAVDPFAMSVLFNLSGAYITDGRVDAASELLRTMEELAPDSLNVLVMKGFAAHGRGDVEAAISFFTQAGGTFGYWGLAMSYFDLGRDEDSDAAIETLVQLGASNLTIANVYAYRDETDLAFEYLERGYELHDWDLIEIRMYAFLDGLHNDPRWNALLEKIGLTDEVGRSIGL